MEKKYTLNAYKIVISILFFSVFHQVMLKYLSIIKVLMVRQTILGIIPQH